MGLRLPALATALVLSSLVNAHPSLDTRSATQNGNKTVIIQMFEWSWDSIASECTNFIGPAGYGFVQVSPPQETIAGNQWWTDYQPVSYNITGKRGNRSQFQSMIQTCNSAGVKVIADTVLNHMSSDTNGTGFSGDSFTKYDYPALGYTNDNFHHCGSSDGDIDDYFNETQVWTCELGGLADLASETEYVRATQAAYINDMLSLGVSGLRLDAAKSINPSDISNILTRMNQTDVYITQEVLWGPGQPVQPANYTGNGDVMEFRYTTALQSAFLGGGIASLQNLDSMGWVDSSHANVFVADHDTERDGSSLNYTSPSNTYVNAHVFSLAHSYGTPTVLSSFEYSDSDQGSPSSGNNDGSCSGNNGTNGWLCQHRWLPVSGMVGFRNNVGSASISNWNSPSSEQISFGRGSAGYVVINNGDSSWKATFTTSLSQGSYCDVISGNSSSGKCTGKGVTIGSDGTFTATVPARSALAVHTGAMGTGGTSTSGALSVFHGASGGMGVYAVASVAIMTFMVML